MVKQIRPARVYQNAKDKLASKAYYDHIRVPPAWMQAVESIPPAEMLTRPYAVQHTEPDPRAKKPRNLYRPTKITYPEDQLRKAFFRDHPWELARPRMVLELDGKDARRRDWSTGLRQPGMQLNGESVVQRQLWLMENKGKSKWEAYDEVRREFYRLRQEEHVERRIAVEEARMVGGYFGKDSIQIGMGLEDKEYERWKQWALETTLEITAKKQNAYTSFGDDEAEDDPQGSGFTNVEDEVQAAARGESATPDV